MPICSGGIWVLMRDMAGTDQATSGRMGTCLRMRQRCEEHLYADEELLQASRYVVHVVRRPVLQWHGTASQ